MSSCGEPESGSVQIIRDEALIESAITIDWPDLIPDGEDERLDQMYNDYYQDLERRLMASQTPLASANSSIDGISEGSPLDEMPQLGTFNTVKDYEDQVVRLPGFIVPLDFEAEGNLSNFLFVPYFGACIHTPPPPPNQVVFVEGDVNLPGNKLWEPYWAVGAIRTKPYNGDIASAAYTLELAALEAYEY
ncbi:MAG: DUF3299 domain-containing protein [Pseudomonadota bacterium]